MSRPVTQSARNSQRGFTLVELLVTALVLSTAFLSATWSMNATARTKEVYAKNQTPAFFLAKEIHELAVALPKTPSGTTGVTTGGAVVALDSLVGARFSPPIFSDGSASDEHDGWKQLVSLAVYDLADPTTPTADAPEDGLASDGTKLYRLEVLVQQDGQDIDTFHWWINP